MVHCDRPDRRVVDDLVVFPVRADRPRIPQLGEAPLTTTDGLGASHANLRDDYEMLLSRAFETDKDAWPDASPASFDPAGIAG